MIRILFVCFCLCFSFSAKAATHEIIKEDSVLHFTAIIDGEAATATLSNYNAEINFYPEQPDKSTIQATVDLPIGSITSDYNGLVEQVTGSSWLNTDVYDSATLHIKAMERKTGNLYTGYGYLTLVGQSLPIKATLYIIEDNKKNLVTATMIMEVNRLMYNIGKGEWKDTSKVDKTVIINGRFVAKPL